MRRKCFVLVLSLIILASALGASFRKEDIKAYSLANGLKVLLLEDHAIPSVALYTFFRVGSRNERPGLTGVSHFIEHMMFNGTAKVGPGDFDRRMEVRGGSNNAYTSDDLTAYMDWFPPAALEPMIEMEADRMQGLEFAPQVFESERGVIASERRLSVDNNNDAILQENVRATAIMAHPYHWDVIGWMSDIQSWRRQEVIDYFRAFYSPNNAVLIVAGDFDGAKALDLIKKNYDKIPVGPPAPAVLTVEPPQAGTKQVLIRKEAQTPSFLMVFHSPKCQDPDFLPLSILEKPLLDGESSRLYRRLVREEKLAMDVGGGIGENIDPQLFTIFVKPKPGADLDRLEAVIGEELNKIRNEGITDAEYAKAINIIRAGYYSGLQSISGKANRIGASEVLYGSYEAVFTRMDDYAAVPIDRIRQAARKYLVDDNKTVGKLIPSGGAQ
jgi:zinc protease